MLSFAETCTQVHFVDPSSPDSKHDLWPKARDVYASGCPDKNYNVHQVRDHEPIQDLCGAEAADKVSMQTVGEALRRDEDVSLSACGLRTASKYRTCLTQEAVENNHHLVLILRDPREVVISWYFYHNAPAKYHSLEHCLQEELAQSAADVALRYWYGASLVDDDAAYRRISDQSNDRVTFVLYRQLMDNHQPYQRLCTALQLNCTESFISSTIQATTMSAMSEMEKERQLPGPNRAGKIHAKVCR